MIRVSGIQILCRIKPNELNYLIDTSSKLSSSIKPSSSSPTTHSPTPAGVPVKMRSPMFKEKYCEIFDTISLKVKIICPVFPCYTICLLLYRQKLMLLASNFSPMSINLPTTAELSHAFAFSQGNPFDFNSF